jgi:hypothetical protein
VFGRGFFRLPISIALFLRIDPVSDKLPGLNSSLGVLPHFHGRFEKG